MSIEQIRKHEFDDDSVCIYCHFDGADDWHQQNLLKHEVGEDEFNYRKAGGEFDVICIWRDKS